MDTMDVDVQRIAKQRTWSEADGQRVVAAWRKSGESRAVFGRRYDIAVHRLHYWITKAAPRVDVAERAAVPFHPVRVLPARVDAERASPIEIRMIRVPRGVALEELRAVLTALDDHR